jgi:trigger factor
LRPWKKDKRSVKVTTEELPARQVRLEIEVDDSQQADAMEKAYRRLAPRVQIRGFRPGKAPRPLIEKQLGHHRILHEAVDILLPEVYKQALEENDITPSGQPVLEDFDDEAVPLVFKAVVPLQPVIDLGDYKSIRVAKDAVTVDEARVEETITSLRRQYGTVEPVDRAAAEGDRVSASVTAKVGDATIYQDEDVEFRLLPDLGLPGLFDAVNGMKKGEQKQSSATLPDDFNDSRYAGKEVIYDVKVNEVKEEKLADLDDAFAQGVGEGFETVQALRERIRGDIEKGEQDVAMNKLQSEAVDALVAAASIEYPEVMVEHEVDHILEDQANLPATDPTAQQLYLSRLGKSEEEIRASVREDAEARLKRSLVLSQFADAENIVVEDADIESEIDTMLSGAGEQAAQLRPLFDNEQTRESMKRTLLTRKTLERLAELVGSDAAPAAAEKKAPARRARKAPRSAETENEGETETSDEK